MTEIKVHNGKPLGFGAILTSGGVNFSIYSRDAHKVSLILFDSEVAEKPSAIIELDGEKNRTGDIWHVLVEGIGEPILMFF